MRNRISFARSMGALGLFALGLSALLVAAPAPAEDEGLPQRFDVIAANIGALGPSGQARLDINIERWSTEEEREILTEALKTDAQRKLPKALRKQDRVGRIREVQGLGYDLNYSREIPMPDGGRQVILATDRPLGFAEVSRNRRSTRYNVTLIILAVDAEGNGEGQMMLGAEFTWDAEAEQLTIENRSSEPVRLTQVRAR
jgi:hypothetical protein